MKSILKIIIHILKLLQKNFECFTSKPNEQWNIEIYILKFIIIKVFCPRAGHSLQTQALVLPKGRSFSANSEIKVTVLLRMNRCGSFPLLSAPHSLFSIWTDLKRSQGAPAWRWGGWVWLTWPSGLHRNSPQELNISYIRVFDQIRDPEIPISLRPLSETNGPNK